jgi:hypothetical protein
MRDLFAEFVANPTRERYLALAELVAAQPDYAPYRASPLAAIDADGARGRYAAELERMARGIAGRLLSPEAHAYMAFLHERLGDGEAAAMEHAIVDACLRGILSTGDGTEAAPYDVLAPGDEYAVLARLGRTSVEQRLVRREGRHYDVHVLDDGGELWFDVSRALAHLSGYSPPTTHRE